MKFSLTLILTCLIVFISSCSISPSQDFVKPNINLKIETSNKNKEIIIQGNKRDAIKVILEEEGFKPIISGG